MDFAVAVQLVDYIEVAAMDIHSSEYHESFLARMECLKETEKLIYLIFALEAFD